MDVEPPFVASGRATEAGDPNEGSLDCPPVAAELLARLDATPSDAGLDLTVAASTATTPMVIGFGGMPLVRASTRTAELSRTRWHGVKQRFEGHAAVDIGRGQEKRERDVPAIDDDVALGSRLPAVHQVWSCGGSPLFAAIDALSMQARLQSILSTSRSRRSTSRCWRSHTPARCQSCNHRQQVTPETRPISRGSISHGMPVRSANRIPVSAARSGTGRRPPFGFTGTNGSSGSMICQSSSETRGDRIPPHQSNSISVQEVLEGVLRSLVRDGVAQFVNIQINRISEEAPLLLKRKLVCAGIAVRPVSTRHHRILKQKVYGCSGSS